MRGRALLVMLAAASLAACGTPAVTDTDTDGGDGRSTPAGTSTPDESSTPAPTPQGTPCAETTEVLVWGLRQWQALAEELATSPGVCTEYFVSIPPVACDPAGKICPRGPVAPADIRALGPQFHAVAEFHWSSWAKWVEDNGSTWEAAGREFRRRMADANYDVAAGDTWSINELPSSVRTGEGPARMNARNVVRGLHEGPAGALPSKGAVFVIGMGHTTTNFSVYKPNLKSWLADAPFWTAMTGRVRFWAQETYADPLKTCVPGSTVASRAQRTNEFAQHAARLAAVGPSTLDEAQAFFDETYVPLLNAAWQQEGTGLGTTTIPITEMAKFTAVQVYANRSWASAHAYPDRRVGFAWAPKAGLLAKDLKPLAERLAWSIRDAYAPGNVPVNACNPAGTYSGCQCSVEGATFNPAWETFASY